MARPQLLVQGFTREFGTQLPDALGTTVNVRLVDNGAAWEDLATASVAVIGPEANVPVTLADGSTSYPVQIVALGVDADQRRALLEHGNLVYVAAALPTAAEVAQLSASLLDATDQTISLYSGSMTEAEPDVLLTLGAALARGLAAQSGVVRLHLAAHRNAPMVAVDVVGQRLLDNPHGEGLAAYTLRTGADVRVARLDADARALVEIDLGVESGAQGALFMDTGRREIGGRMWNIVVALTLPPFSDDAAIRKHVLSLLDALCAPDHQQQRDASWGKAAHVYRVQARRAHSQPADASYVPQFAPRWARRLGRVWLGLLPILPIALLLPVPEIIHGTAEVVVPDAPMLAAPGAADVRELDVRLGEHVKAGQVLLKLADPEAESALASAFSDYRALLRRRLESAEGSDDAALAQAWERMQDRLRQRELPVLAPVDGIVTELPVAAGRTVAAGEALALVMPSVSQPVLELELPARQRTRMRSGQQGTLRLSDSREEVAFRLDNVSGVVRNNSGNAVLRARAHLLGEHAGLAPGERGSVSLRVGRVPIYRLLWPQWHEGAS